MSLDPTSLDPAQLEHFRSVVTSAVYMISVWKRYYLAGMTLLFFDWIITLNLEIERIWKSRSWSLWAMWLAIRYFPLISGPLVGLYVFGEWSEETCRRYSSFPSAVILVYVCITHIAFTARTYALYARDRRVLAALVSLLTVEISIFTWGLATENYTGDIGLLSTFPGCTPSVIVGKSGLGVWAMAFGFDVAVMGLTLYKSIRYWLQHERSNVLNVLLRDGVAYFAVIFTFYIINLVYYLTQDYLWKLLHTTFGGLLSVIFTSRLIINLRGVSSSRAPIPLDSNYNGRANGQLPQGQAFTAYESVMEDFMSAFLQARDEEAFATRGTRDTVTFTKDDDEVVTLDG